MELLGISKNKIAKNENGENISYIEIGRVVLVHCNLVNYVCKIQESCVHFFPKR